MYLSVFIFYFLFNTIIISIYYLNYSISISGVHCLFSFNLLFIFFFIDFGLISMSFNRMGYIVPFLTISSILIDVYFTSGVIFNANNYWYLLPYSNQFTLHYSILFLIISITIIILHYHLLKALYSIVISSLTISFILYFLCVYWNNFD